MTDENQATGDAGEVAKVDQVGYLPDAEKIGVVAADESRFRVLRAGDGTEVHSGELSEPIREETAGETVRQADFSGLTEPGEYVLEVGDERSYPFEIAEGLYDDLLRDVGRVYTLKRSNTAITDPETGLDVPPGHTQDAEARMFFGDEFRDEGTYVDVAGGWYDAGDYGKYVPPAAVTLGQMLLAYEQYLEAFSAGQFGMPDGLSEPERYREIPDVLAEAKFEFEWLFTMQRPDGALYHKVSAEEWTGFYEAPTEDTLPRRVFGLSTYGTAMFAGAAALGARLYREHDPAFANELLDAARKAQSYLEANREPYFRFDEGQDGGSGPYEGRKDGDDSERFWAAAELLKTTGEQQYADYIESELAEQFDEAVRPPVWDDTLSLGQWAYLTADEADPDRAETLEAAFVEYADDLVAAVEGDGYRCALDVKDYHWASTKVALAKGNLLLLANEIAPDESYVAAALDQLHYAFGRTATGYSYVTGFGEQPPQNPHDRLVEGTDTYIPGMVISGANRNGDDQWLAEFIEEESPPPAKAFIDVFDAYSATEWAIDYSAPLVFTLAHAHSSS